MARRSSSSRWSRPATGKQIAALKAHGNYDGKYYSVGRASQAIGGSARGSSTGGRRSGGNFTLNGARRLLQLLEAPDGLDSMLQPALGRDPSVDSIPSALASSGLGPTGLLSGLLGVPNDLDLLVQLALEETDPDGLGSAHEDGTVEAVMYTLVSDESDPSHPRILINAEVVRNPDFSGPPSVKVRFDGDDEPRDVSPSAPAARRSGERGGLGYRPRWTPTLVRTPQELAEQMRQHWSDAVEELANGIDARAITFLAGSSGMESALAVLNSAQPSTSKFVLLQGLLDPTGPIQFRGLGLDAASVAEQIRSADAGDEFALSWLRAIQQEQVLTSFAEVTGTSLAAEADFRLALWSEQGNSLIDAVTMKAKHAQFSFAGIRSEAALQAQREELRAKVAKLKESAPEAAENLQRLIDRLDTPRIGNLFDHRSPRKGYSLSEHHGRLEDWFFEESRAYLKARLDQSLPAQFAAALTPSADFDDAYAGFAKEVRRLASESSTEPSDYSAGPVSSSRDLPLATLMLASRQLADSDSEPADTDRIERVVQAVRRTTAELERASDDDLGTLVVAEAVLGYAKWRRDELRAMQQTEEADRQRLAASQRYEAARGRATTAQLRDKNASKSAGAARSIEQTAEGYAETLARSTGPIQLCDPLPASAEADARARLEHASAREGAAGDWLASAVERERWAAAELDVAATPSVQETLREERDAAVAEQSDASAERQAAQEEQRTAQSDLTLIVEARAKFEDLMRPVRQENQQRLQAETERSREEEARRAEESRQRAEASRRRWAEANAREDAENRRQEERNQRQQDRARAAKDALGPELERLLALPDSASVWRRKALAAKRASLEQTILALQNDITGPLVPPPTRAKRWPAVLSRTERYLGTVKKMATYGVFVTLPAGTDGLVRGTDASASLSAGQLIAVEIVDMPPEKPIVLTLISSK